MKRSLLAISLAVCMFAACDDDDSDVTPTPEPTATETAGVVTATSVPATATPGAESVLEVLRFARGEPITNVPLGALFLDIETGDVEVVTLVEEPTEWVNFSISPDNRFVFASAPVGVLFDRRSGRAWGMADLPGAPLTLNHNELVATSEFIVFRAEAENEFLVTDDQLLEVSRFALAEEAEYSGIEAWIEPAGANVLFRKRDLSLVSLETGTVTSLSDLGFTSRDIRPELLDDGFALALTDRSDETRPTCTVWQLSWIGTLLSETDIEPCNDEPLFPDAYAVSPDGTLIAKWRALSPHQDGGVGGNPILGAVEVFEASSGNVLFRVRGAALPRYFRISNSPWLADSSALVLNTRDGNRLVSRDGAWLPLLVEANFAVPSPHDTTAFALDRTGVLHSDVDEFVALMSEGLPGFINPWGTTGGEARYVLPVPGADDADVYLLAAPSIASPPFGPDVLEVRGATTCLNVREFPDATSSILTCATEGSRLQPHPTDLYGFLSGSPRDPREDARLVTAWFARDEACPGEVTFCAWVSVETQDGDAGWVAPEYLAWPGTPPPPAED